MKTKLNCPCGTLLTGADEDELVSTVQQHLKDAHGRAYDREDILAMAY